MASDVKHTFICRCGSHVEVGHKCANCKDKTGPPAVNPENVKVHIVTTPHRPEGAVREIMTKQGLRTTLDL